MPRIFYLRPYKSLPPNKNKRFYRIVITPEPEKVETVSAAWAYVIKHTAISLEEADHDAAIRLLKERHPSWQIFNAETADIPVILAHADRDTPEGDTSE